MFWRRDKPLKVELITPIHLTAPSAPAAHLETADEHAAKEAKTNTDLAFKLITFGALASQAALVIYGYSLLVGKYQQYGIDLRIPRPSGHLFHEHPATDSTLIRPPIPHTSGHS